MAEGKLRPQSLCLDKRLWLGGWLWFDDWLSLDEWLWRLAWLSRVGTHVLMRMAGANKGLYIPG